MKTISIVTPCYNEEANVEELYKRVRAAIALVDQYRYEHIFIDNASTDNTVAILRDLASKDKCVKVIVNARNFGHIRSPFYAILQSKGDAVISIVADLQDPPELIPAMVEQWEKGSSVVLGVKEASDEHPMMFWVRTKYYQFVDRLADLKTFPHFTGFGLYDRRVIDIIRSFKDPYPYFRGMIAEIGLPHSTITYRQKRRTRGFTKNNFYTLWDLAMLGITNLSKVPLRFITFLGFMGALLCSFVSVAYLLYKLLFWKSFTVGIAPMVIGVFFLGSIQLVVVGVLGEYVGAIHTQVMQRPLVIERERINFD